MRRQSRILGVGVILAAVVLGTAGVQPCAAVTTYDLTTEGSLAVINGAIFTPFNPETATGTGIFEPFVRIQGNGVESGYNTDGEIEFQTKPGAWTHSLLVSDVPPVDVGGTLYREFLLDIDQTGGDGRYLSLDQLVISLEGEPDMTDYPFGAPIYSLDDGADRSILLDAKLFAGPGNGTGDLRVLIPDDLFGGDGYIYLYSVLGEQVVANNGFEEWGILAGDGTPRVPAPGAVLLAGIGVGLVGWLRRKKLA